MEELALGDGGVGDVLFGVDVGCEYCLHVQIVPNQRILSICLLIYRILLSLLLHILRVLVRQLRIQPYRHFAQGHIDLIVDVFQIRGYQELVLFVLVGELVDELLLVSQSDGELGFVETEDLVILQILQLS